MNRNTCAWSLAYGLISVMFCGSVTAGGCIQAIRDQPRPRSEEPVPAVSAQMVAVGAVELDVGTDDLWIDDRSRIDAPLVSAELPAETQWIIFDLCGQDAELFCSVMAIAAVESDFTTDLIGDDGDSIGMMQINTHWHTGRMEALGVTDLTDPVQCGVGALDYPTELEEDIGAGPGDHRLYVGYNAGPSKAKRTSFTAYSQEVMAAYRGYLAEMGSMTLNK